MRTKKTKRNIPKKQSAVQKKVFEVTLITLVLLFFAVTANLFMSGLYQEKHYQDSEKLPEQLEEKELELKLPQENNKTKRAQEPGEEAKPAQEDQTEKEIEEHESKQSDSQIEPKRKSNKHNIKEDNKKYNDDKHDDDKYYDDKYSYDKYDYNIVLYVTVDGLIDRIKILAVDFEARELFIKSISKNTRLIMSKAPGEQKNPNEKEISLAKTHNLGEGTLVKKAVEIITGTRPDYYVTTSKDALKEVLSRTEDPIETARQLREEPSRAYNMWRKVNTDISPLKLIEWNNEVDDYIDDYEFKVKN